MNNKIAAGVILYNPDYSIIYNIYSYLEDIDHLFIIDNSENSASFVVKELGEHHKISYHKNSTNVGIAEALNQAARFAIENSFTFLLTMDQDSYFKRNDLKTLISYLNNVTEDIAIISPLHNHGKYKPKKVLKEQEEVLYTMTSGNLLNLELYKIIGNFLSELFIDHVDHEYGLRINSRGFKVLQISKIQLIHSLGTLKKVKLGRIFLLTFISHSPTRTYYMIRNGLYVSKLYKTEFPKFARKNLILTLKELLKLFAEDNKLLRLKLIIKAFEDYKKNKMGKLDYQNN